MRGAGIRGLLKAKGPEVFLEALFVVFAVLVALAVDEWAQDRELRERAEQARSAVISELTRNQEELAGGSESTVAMLGSITEALERIRAGEELEGLGVSGELPDFTDAAWEVALVTGAVARMDYDWVLETARVYELQDLVWELQTEFVSYFAQVAVRRPGEEPFTKLQGQLAMLASLHQELSRRYSDLLGEPANETEGV